MAAPAAAPRGWLVQALTASASALLSALVTLALAFTYLGQDVVRNSELPEKIRAYSTYTEDAKVIQSKLDTAGQEMRDLKASLNDVQKQQSDIAANQKVQTQTQGEITRQLSELLAHVKERSR